VAQRQLRAAFPDIREVYMSPPAFFRIVDACKLFDYDARRWLDFDGRATGPVLITGNTTFDRRPSLDAEPALVS
jgi:hypothetical protein